MSSLDYDQLLYSRAGWRKRVLVPLWTFQVAILLCLMCLFTYRLAETFDHYEEGKQRGRPPTVELVWEASNVACNAIALVLNCLEIARLATERLTPFFMVCTHVIKFTLALAVLSLDITAYTRGIDGIYPSLGMGLDMGLIVATLIVLVYSAWNYRRLLEYETYQLASVRASAGAELGYRPPSMISKPAITATTTTRVSYAGDDTEPEYTVPYPPYNVYRDNYRTSLSPPHTQARQEQTPPSYESAATERAATPPEKQPSAPALVLPSASSDSAPQPLSPADLRREIDRALDAEFGWGDSSSGNASAAPGAPARTELDRSRSVVLGGGSVAVRPGLVAPGASPAGTAVAEVQRKASWRTELVVEDGGPEVGDHDGHGGKEEDEQALLGRGGR
ncbi:hypothetical protein VTJ83DRAFT_3245 [Remersonia thermophila]|uniref:Uncharacterized protein n=1 Tax=Remersonia thermophila TaxID=72144 RepID=A0ABR4DED5_9PEZI